MFSFYALSRSIEKVPVTCVMSVCPHVSAARARPIYRELCMKICVRFVAAGDKRWTYQSSVRVEWYQAFTIAEEV